MTRQDAFGVSAPNSVTITRKNPDGRSATIRIHSDTGEAIKLDAEQMSRLMDAAGQAQPGTSRVDGFRVTLSGDLSIFATDGGQPTGEVIVEERGQRTKIQVGPFTFGGRR